MFTVTMTMISTGIIQLDDFFCGKVPDGILIDIFGASGIGKTQLAMQICIHTVSHNNRILFQDTTGAFRPERMLQMLQTNNLPVDLLNNISVLRITNVSEQINSLSRIDPSKYSLIVIDNISDLFSFEYSTEDKFLKKNQLFLKYMRNLSMFAIENKITVLLTNVMRTINNKHIENHETMMNVFTHAKIKLEQIDDKYQCTCFTAFEKTRFYFKIKPSGLVSIP